MLKTSQALRALRRLACAQKSRRNLVQYVALEDNSLIVFPGGGIYFWWQAGALKALQEKIVLDKCSLSGASAGALIAVLAGCNVDMDYAFGVAERLADEHGVWKRNQGLMGVWGNIIYEWLDILLPENAADLCRGRVSVAVTSVQSSFPPLKRMSVNDFPSRNDLIQACLASVHIPFFLNGRAFTGLRGSTCVDGSLTFLLRGKSWHVGAADPTATYNVLCAADPKREWQPALVVNHRDDAELMGRGWSCLQTLSQDEFRDMFQRGYRHMLRTDHHRGHSSNPPPTSHA